MPQSTTSRDALGRQLQPNHSHGYGMQKLCARLLSLYVDKFGQSADWRQMKNIDEIKEYAAHWILFCICSYIKNSTQKLRKEKTPAASRFLRWQLAHKYNFHIAAVFVPLADFNLLVALEARSENGDN
jgi:hypothetical protein